MRLLPPGQRAVPFAVENNCWAYDLYDCSTQAMSSNYSTQAMSSNYVDEMTAAHAFAQFRSATCGRPSSTSWPASPGWSWLSAGKTGIAVHSPTKAPAMSRSGRREAEHPDQAMASSGAHHRFVSLWLNRDPETETR